MRQKRNHRNRSPISLDKARKSKQLQRAIPKGKRLIILLSAILAIILGVVLVTRPNAYEVKVGDEVIGIIKSEQVLEESLDIVVAMLKEKYKAEVKVVNEPILNTVHASKKDIVTADYLISQIKKNVQCEIQMVEFIIDGQSKGIFKSKEEIGKLIKRITDKYISKDMQVIKEARLEASIDYKNVYVTEDKLSDPEKVYDELTKTQEEGRVYTVRSGDNLWAIAEKNEMKIDEIIWFCKGFYPTWDDSLANELKAKLELLGSKKVGELSRGTQAKLAVSVRIVEEVKKEDGVINNIYIDGLLQETITN